MTLQWRVGRDVTAPIKAEVVQRQDRGVVLPYDGVHVDFVLGTAA